MPAARFASFHSASLRAALFVQIAFFVQFALCVCAGLALSTSARAAGTWTPLTNDPPEAIGLMLVLTDGRIMAQGTYNNTWYALTPDANGSYANGTWSQLASMTATRLYFASQVLQNGDVLVGGGEYSSAGDFTNTCEIYHPLTNTWGTVPTPTYSNGNQWQYIGDSVAHTLPNGKVLMGNILDAQSALYDYTTNTWTPSAQPLNGRTDEESWALLPNGSLLTVDTLNSPPAGHNTAERYIPSTDSWVQAGLTPNMLVEPASAEIGPGMLLPTGSVLFTGATGHTALFNTATSAWSAGPDLYGTDSTTLLALKDAAGCVEVNGKALLCAAPNGNGSADDYPSGQHFLEYTPDANGGSFVEIAPPSGLDVVDEPAYDSRMTQLPNGQVLFADVGQTSLFVYTPDSGPDPAWKPTITSVTPNGDGSYLIQGTQFNGLSDGGCYGDDSQQASNYPLVRLTDTSGNVYYARTFNHSTMGVATGSTVVSTNFTLPAGLPATLYSLQVVANGIPSSAVAFGAIATTTALASDTNPSVVGQSVTFTATVTTATGSAPVPEGNVDFVDTTTSTDLGTVPVNATTGKASVSTSSLSVGGHSIMATYSDGTTGVYGGSSHSLMQVVNQASTTTTLTLPSTTPVSTQTFSISATVAPVAPGAGTPTGTVTFNVNGTPQDAPLTNGTASITIGPFIGSANGSVSISAAYNGDTNFTGSATGTQYQPINNTDTTTTLTLPATTPDSTQTFTVAAAVTSVSPGAGTPGGYVNFTVNGQTQTVRLSNSGAASIVVGPFAAGQVTVSAAYNGFPSFNPSASGTQYQTINNPAPTIVKQVGDPIPAGSPGFSQLIKGTGFVPSSVVSFDGTARATKYVSATQLRVYVTKADLATARKIAVVVTNPAPGGGTSNTGFLLVTITGLRVMPGSVTSDGNGGYLVPVTVTNIGYASAVNARLLSASLGGASTTTPLPVKLGTLTAGQSKTVTLSFPSSAGTSGQSVTLLVRRTYQGDPYHFQASQSVTLP